MALSCLNCHETVPEDKVRIFAGVFCCSVCHQRAERLYKNLQTELDRMLLMMRESIRIAIIEGKLHYGTADGTELSKTELLRAAVQLQELKDSHDKPVSVGPDGRPLPTRR